MPSPQQLNTELSRVFFADIVGLYPESERQYDCPGISDIHYCQLGVLRCLSSSVTGQEFLQYHADQNVADIEPGHFFKALKSARRLGNITSLNDLPATPMTRHVADPYAQCRELDDWEVYAVDGHYHKAASFDPKREASEGTVRATATGHFFRVNMRTHHLSCLAMAEPKDGKKKEHDMAAIKRSTAEALRNGAPKGRKVMLVWDKACIDYQLWAKLKYTYGIYFTTCEKSNSAARICSADLLDRSEPRNAGVVSEHLVGRTEGLRDEVEEKKQAGRIKAAPRIIVQAVRNFINSALTRATQRTQRFIRWVRVRLYLDAPWSESMARLRELWTLPN